MDRSLRRAIYGIEYCAALIAFFQLWPEVGGQSHLDLMPWWSKAVLGCGVSLAFVKVTAAATRARAFLWCAVLAALLAAAGGLAYYEHLHEPGDESGQEETAVPTLLQRHPQSARPVRKLHQQTPVRL